MLDSIAAGIVSVALGALLVRDGQRRTGATQNQTNAPGLSGCTPCAARAKLEMARELAQKSRIVRRP